MAEADDIKFMRRCIELACKAEGFTYPNPLVGAVVVHKGNIIGEGYHLKAGDPHAEVVAINSVSDKKWLNESTLYVNLEPCSHFGKTPPCADFIISNSIPRVVIGAMDTSEKVSGKGMVRLRAAGCEVVMEVAGDECRRLNRRFFTYHEKKRPYITLKWAESADGYLDLLRREGEDIGPNWITGRPERALVHKWRAAEQSILVGAATVRADNPKLNVRDWSGRNPLRMVLSGSGAINMNASLFEKEGAVIFTHNMIDKIPGTVRVKINDEEPVPLQISKYLFDSGIQSLFVEGGAMVLGQFISSGLWDEARVFTGKTIFRQGVRAPVPEGRLLSKTIFEGSSLSVYLK